VNTLKKIRRHYTLNTAPDKNRNSVSTVGKGASEWPSWRPPISDWSRTQHIELHPSSKRHEEKSHKVITRLQRFSTYPVTIHPWVIGYRCTYQCLSKPP